MDKLLVYKQKLIDVFHDDVFSELMNFWRIVEQKEYDYKIFVSKKCYVLYKIFMPLFDFPTYSDCIKITDTAIPIFYKEMEGKTVLIIDDVFIHGRTSLRINGQISQKAKKVDFFVFAKNNYHDMNQDMSTEGIQEVLLKIEKKQKNLKENIEIENYASYFINKLPTYKEKLKEINLFDQSNLVKGYVNCDEYRWKRISDLIMKSLWSVNMPYVSYLPIVIMNRQDRLASCRFVRNSKAYNSHRQQELEQHFSYHICSNEKKRENNYSIIHYCFIISSNSFTKDCKLTPMVFFDCENTSINKSFVIKSLQIIYGNAVDELLAYFPKATEENNRLITILKFLIFCVGYLAVRKLLFEHGVRRTEYKFDCTNAIYSFGEGIEKYLFILDNVNENDVLRKIEKNTIKNVSFVNNVHKKLYQEEHRDLLSGLEESYSSMKSCSIEKDSPDIVNVLARYFKYNNIHDEKDIYKPKRENYIRGLKFSEIKEFLKERGFSINDIISGLMYQYNLGAATIDFLYDYKYYYIKGEEREKICGFNMYWRSGEQSYKCISRTYVLLVYYQYLYNKRFDNKIAMFLYDILVEVAESNYAFWNIPFSRKDLEKYCSIKDNVYNAFDIEEYCKQREFKQLGYIGKQIEQYVLWGNIQEIEENDKKAFKEQLLLFIKEHADENMAIACEKIIRCGKER